MRAQRIKLLQGFIKENPADPFNKYALALEYLAEDTLDEAQALFETLLTHHTDYLPTYYQAAQFYWADNEMDRANQIFQDGIDLATRKNDLKALAELKSAHQNFSIEWDE